MNDRTNKKWSFLVTEIILFWWVQGWMSFKLSSVTILVFSIILMMKNHYHFFKQEIGLLFTLLLIVTILIAGIIHNSYFSLLFVTLGVLVFFLMELLHERVLKREENKTIIYQNKLMKQQMDETEKIYMTMRAWRHDYHNHLQALKGYLHLDKIDLIKIYLDELETDLKNIDKFYHSGNMQVDAIINGKCAIAEQDDIKLEVTCEVPPVLSVNDLDLCVILGNLLDNAIESCRKIEEKENRFIRITIGTLKKQLYIHIMNSTDESLEIRTAQYFSTKRGDHGYGLNRVDKLVEKYDGYLKRANEIGVFATEIILPL